MVDTPLSRAAKLLSIIESGVQKAELLDMDIVAARLHELIDLLRPLNPA